MNRTSFIANFVAFSLCLVISSVALGKDTEKERSQKSVSTIASTPAAWTLILKHGTQCTTIPTGEARSTAAGTFVGVHTAQDLAEALAEHLVWILNTDLFEEAVAGEDDLAISVEHKEVVIEPIEQRAEDGALSHDAYNRLDLFLSSPGNRSRRVNANPMIAAYRTPMAEDSVGVATPKTTMPTISTGISSTYDESAVSLAISPSFGRTSSFGYPNRLAMTEAMPS